MLRIESDAVAGAPPLGLCAKHLFDLAKFSLTAGCAPSYAPACRSAAEGHPSVLCHVLLGFLRDGRARHGYELLTEYRALTGEQLNAGNLYRELARLAGDGFVHATSNPPDADPRRIPYEITER